jgi:hypothetical protein
VVIALLGADPPTNLEDVGGDTGRVELDVVTGSLPQITTIG